MIYFEKKLAKQITVGLIFKFAKVLFLILTRKQTNWILKTIHKPVVLVAKNTWKVQSLIGKCELKESDIFSYPSERQNLKD